MRTLMRRNWGADISPWNELESVGERLRRMVTPEMNATFFTGAAPWVPPVELIEDDHEFVLTAEVPGLAANDFDLEIDDGVLTLQGDKRESIVEQDGRRYIRERSYGHFERSFTLPKNVEMDKIKAEFHDGLVEVHLPKGEKDKGRHIPVTAN